MNFDIGCIFSSKSLALNIFASLKRSFLGHGSQHGRIKLRMVMVMMLVKAMS